ncbi:MAG TPA: TIGR02996 domain-containing protein [Gemmataceae bacterium]|jgi:uncharacterized protein (TIGR02996 family)|nr:TIGR02996 domain-containing protein [Gemmataceae bacterium]
MEHGFLRDIIDHPDDDAPRLIYADWLDDHGRPERAEFIRVQCELARLPSGAPLRGALQAREAELLKAHERSWVPADRLALFFEWRRGFVTALKPCARGIFAGEDSLKVLAEFPFTEELEFSFCMGDEEFQYMPDLPILRAFGIGGNVRVTAASLARIGRWRTLRRLRLNGDEVTDNALSHLAALVELRDLDLSYSEVTDAGLPRLAPLTALESLDLSETGVTGSGLDALRALPRLRRLNLSNTRVWDHGIDGLVGCRSLEELRLESHYQDRPLRDVDLAPLERLPALRILDLGWWCEPSDIFLATLRRSLSIQELWYNGAKHGEAGAVAAGGRIPPF